MVADWFLVADSLMVMLSILKSCRYYYTNIIKGGFGMLDCVLCVLANVDEAIQDGTKKVIDAMEEAVTDPEMAKKAANVNWGEFIRTLKWGILSISIVVVLGIIYLLLKKPDINKYLRYFLLIALVFFIIVGIVVLIM